MKTKFPNNLIDKNGQLISDDDVIFDGKDYYRIYWNPRYPQVEAISPTNGYLHNLTQKEIKNFERCGTFNECEHLLFGNGDL